MKRILSLGALGFAKMASFLPEQIPLAGKSWATLSSKCSLVISESSWNAISFEISIQLNI